jgi:protease I
MMDRLDGMKIAILVADGVEDPEIVQPLETLRQAGATVHVVSPQAGVIRTVNHMEPGRTIPVDRTLEEATAADYDGVIVPGGLFSPDRLRTEAKAIEFVRAAMAAGKVVGSVCHGPWVLIEAGVVEGRTMTSWPAIRTDLRNAGAIVVDQEVVVDKGLVTSRWPDDMPAFTAKFAEELREGRHHRTGG